MRIAIIAQDNYMPWQQVYAIVGRLPEDTVCEIVSLDNRVGGMVEKAAAKHGHVFEYMTWKGATEWCDLLILMYMPHEEGRVYARYSAVYASKLGKLWYAIHPELYTPCADAIESLTAFWSKHGTPTR